MTCTWRKHSNSSPYLFGRHITLCVCRDRERERKKEKKWGRKLGIIRKDSRRLNEDRLIQCVVRCYHRRLLKLNASELMTDDESYLPVKASDPQDLCTFMDSKGLCCQSLTWRAGGLVYTSPPECCYLLMDNILNTSISLISFKETFIGQNRIRIWKIPTETEVCCNHCMLSCRWQCTIICLKTTFLKMDWHNLSCEVDTSGNCFPVFFRRLLHIANPYFAMNVSLIYLSWPLSSQPYLYWSETTWLALYEAD